MPDKEPEKKPAQTPDKEPEKGSGESNTPASLTQADLDKAAEAAAAKARADAQADFARTFKETTGAESPEAYKAAQLEAEGKHKEAAELANAKAAKSDARVKELLGQSAVTTVAAELKAIAPADVYSLVKGRVEVDDSEKVTIGGQDPKTFIEAYLKEKPYLVSSSGKTGSGSQPGGAPAKVPFQDDRGREDRLHQRARL
jgi:hypothetical protein